MVLQVRLDPCLSLVSHTPFTLGLSLIWRHGRSRYSSRNTPEMLFICGPKDFREQRVYLQIRANWIFNTQPNPGGPQGKGSQSRPSHQEEREERPSVRDRIPTREGLVLGKRNPD